MGNRPVTGGVVSVLQFIAVISVLLAFFGGALAGLSLGAEFILMVSVFVTATLMWAMAAIIQELRNITFNTQPMDDEAIEPAPLPADRSAGPASAFNAGGMR